MAFYDNSQWSAAPGQAQRQLSWEQQPPSRSGTSSVGAAQESNAFIYQLAEVERAIDNLVKSGKMPFGFYGAPMYGQPGLHRPPMPGSEFDRPQSSGLQNYYQVQRGGSHRGPYGGGEQAQAEQAKRRMAAQRERELRNYHQEQQYAKNLSGPKSDRSMSPNTGMSEEERRELIARQHRALYGETSNLYESAATKGNGRTNSQDARILTGGARGASPLAYDPFSAQSSGAVDGAVQMPSRGDGSGVNANKDGSANNSPAQNQNPTFGSANQQSDRTSNSSPTGGSPPGGSKAGPGAIGTRPAVTNAPVQGLQKRSTTPLPSPLSYGFSANDQNNNERSTSASSNPPQEKGNYSTAGWGSSSGVWGNKGSGLGVQASVWG
ncbi:hypothetical protein, variant [Verruconis gallopava]|uniref:Uncharacterized protein n=1 Tax=Verruconis gallopava TaxID=253628 RepID=A0A0D1XEL7_9PEZI|nr:uncharacterized protein PV09_07826 [Verruconis gallopava]XP_016210501.1 hypothetical protein, variant [Verruconis gallopava]KIW00631.1 hypothetical protein PV09_07826 [Verruconis gallopava]KIW00632.1 hypothetical protein, variant [Verruconis gallopava]